MSEEKERKKKANVTSPQAPPSSRTMQVCEG
jgi:hypothetical protein